MKSLTTWVMVLAISTASGCVTQRDQQALEAKADKTEKDLAQARADLDKTRSDLDATRQRLDNALRANADSSSEVLSSRERLNDVGGRVDEVQRGVEDLKRDVAASRTEIYARLDDLKRAQQPPATPAPPPIAVPADKAAHFAQLRDAYTKRDGPTLRALGPEYVNRYPTDEHADEALFFLGDGDLRDGRPSSALGHFNRLLKLFPRSKVLDRTLFDMGEAYLLMHDCANAKTAYEACAKRFATQKPGIDSKAKLQTIAKNPPGLCAPQ